MKSLVIAPQPFFTPRGTPMSVYYRALVMAQQNVQIDLLTYGEGEDVDIPGVRTIRTPRFAWFGNVKTGPSVLKIFLDIFIALWATGLVIRNRYDFVHAHEESVFIAVVLQPVFRFKLVYDMHSSLPEQLQNFGWSKSNLLRRLFAAAENGTLKRANAVITICPALADHALSIIENDKKHFLIENSIYEPVRLLKPANDADVNEQVDIVFRQLEKAGAKRTILYAGTLETYQGIDLLLQSMQFVKRECPTAHLIVVGGSEQQVLNYQTIAKALGVSEVCVFNTRVPQAVAKAFAARSDILTSPRTRGMNTPLKIYELLDSGKPLVATRIHSHTQVLTDEVAFLSAVDPNAFGAELVRAATDTDAVEKVVKGARTLYASNYSPKAYGEKIARLLEHIS